MKTIAVFLLSVIVILMFSFLITEEDSLLYFSVWFFTLSVSFSILR